MESGDSGGAAPTSGGSKAVSDGAAGSAGLPPFAQGGSAAGAASGGNGGRSFGGGGSSSGAGGAPSGAGGAPSGGSTATGGTGSNCPARPARCPTKLVKSTSTWIVGEVTPPDQFLGVTDIDGAVDITDAVGLTAFDCLESISGKLYLRDGTSDAPKFGNAFPNLVSATTIDVDGTFSSQSVDCLFQSLTRVDSFEISGGVKGTLNLAGLTEFTHIVVHATDLTRVNLPDSGTFNVSQLHFRQNYSLREIAGFKNVTLTGAPGQTSPFYSLGFVSNPGVSGCRVLELVALFRAAGYVEGSFYVGTPTCP